MSAPASPTRLLMGIAWLAAGTFLAAWLAVLVASPLADRYAWLPTPLGLASLACGGVGIGMLAYRSRA